MPKKNCDCLIPHSEQAGCAGCAGASQELYWCDSCSTVVSEKRCPLCGLKTRKAKSSDPR